LDEEEAVLQSTSLWGTSVSRRPYGELDFVEKTRPLFCFHALSTSFGMCVLKERLWWGIRFFFWNYVYI